MSSVILLSPSSPLREEDFAAFVILYRKPPDNIASTWGNHIIECDTFQDTVARTCDYPSWKALRHDRFMRATTTGLICRFATGKAMTAGAGQ